MRVMRRVLIGVVAIGLLVAGWAGPGEAAAEPTTVRVRDVVFEAGDVLTVALHPSTTPIELSARRLDLEACPGTWDGKVATTSGSSWPKRDGFTECIPFTDGAVALPSAGSGGGTMHLVFAVRARAATTRPGTLTIRYEPVDGFFMVGPPALSPGARTPTIVVTPDSATVAAGTASFADEDPSPDLDGRPAHGPPGRAARAARAALRGGVGVAAVPPGDARSAGHRARVQRRLRTDPVPDRRRRRVS